MSSLLVAIATSVIIAETDGTMIPILKPVNRETEAEPLDKRKARQGGWKEACLSLTHPQGSVSSVFGGTIGSPDEVGDQLLHCALRSGRGQTTSVPSVGDGAPWIAHQVDRVFGGQGEFLVDFYHLCEYLSAASTVCAPHEASLFFYDSKTTHENRSAHDGPECVTAPYRTRFGSR